MNKFQIIFFNIFIILVFVVLYFVYPEYKQKNDLEDLEYRAKQYTAQLENYALDAIERQTFDNFYDTYFSIINSANIKYISIEDENYEKLFQFNINYLQTLELKLEKELKPIITDSTIHIKSRIYNQNNSLVATLSVGFDVYHIYQEISKFRIIAIGITLVLLVLMFFIIIYTNNKSNKKNEINQSTYRSTGNTGNNNLDISKDNTADLSKDLKDLTKNLTLLINEFNVEKKEKDTSLIFQDVNNLNIRLESEFVAKLYKVFNNYRKITNTQDILNLICKDVCDEFLYDVSFLMTWENKSLVMYDSYVRDIHSFQDKFNKKFKNLPIKASESIYEIYRTKEPIYTDGFPYCDLINDYDNNTHFAFIPIQGNNDFWGVLAIGLMGKDVKVGYRDVSRMLFYSNTVGSFLENIKNFNTMGNTLKSKTRELVKANTLLRRSIREKDEFLRAISHDLIAPLRNIAGLINSIERKYGESLDNGLQDRLFRIRRNVEKDMDLVNEILEISKVKSRKLVIEKVDLNKLIFSIFENFNHELQEKKIKVKIQDKFPIIYFDRFIINQILQNLIDNAIKYIQADATDRNIELKWRYVHGKLAFAIADTGIGIAPEELDKIFSIFYRSNNEMNVETEGKGVGLAMIKSLLEKFNGEIWVKSKVGEGSIFYFTFPNSVIKPPAIKKI